MFTELQKLSPIWPEIMWQTFGDDGVNKSLELGELISRNLQTRMEPFGFSDEILKKSEREINKSELRNVLEGERFLKSDQLHENDLAPGDVFKISSDYYINIRAACDLFPNRSIENPSYDDIKLYLLKGTNLSPEKVKEAFNEKYGHFSEIDSQAIVFPINDGKAIDFRFKELKIERWADVKNNRIGRILPPYINRIQQKYSLFMQRQGLPRIPIDAV